MHSPSPTVNTAHLDAVPGSVGTLHILCGKIAAGKSTLARQLSEPVHHLHAVAQGSKK